MRTALVYDRVNKWGGAERVLITLHKLFPHAPLYTSVYNSETARWAKVFPQVITSFLQKIPLMQSKHEIMAPLMPLAFETLDLTSFDLVISVTSEAAKGVITKPSAKHICYCLTPTRYLWSHHRTYFNNQIFKNIAWPVVNYLKCWDVIAAQRPDLIIAVSHSVQKRIKKYYRRDSQVVYPPVSLDKFEKKKIRKLRFYEKCLPKNFFLVVSRLVDYKKVDLAIKAFNELNYPLVIVGTGKQESFLKYIAKDNVFFVKNLTEAELARYYQEARALIFPQDEDFGLVAVEAQAAGTPVIAYKSGGALDIVIDGKTGIFFDKQDEESLISAVERFENMNFHSGVLTNSAKKFSEERFKRSFFSLINDLI